MKKNRIAIIGAGAVGLFAAASVISDDYNQITVFEKNSFTGKKLLITGKGRCNVTNNCDLQEFMSNIPQNSKFLFSAMRKLSTQDTIDFFVSLGVPLKTERGKRMFPESDKAADIRDALYKRAVENGTEFIFDTVKDVKESNCVFTVITKNSVYEFDRVIIATGGASYPRTGSTGDGYRFAKNFGHTVTPLYPSLVPLVCREKYLSRIMGLSLKNVKLSIVDSANGKVLWSDLGEMLFTHFGISGPLVLTASSYVRNINSFPDRFLASIDLKPALSFEELDKRILSDFTKYQNRDFVNALNDLLPSKLIPVVIERSGIPERTKVCVIKKEDRQALVRLLKEFTLQIRSTRPIDEAIITSGGVKLSEIDPSTMQSKLCDGLYFAGEILDIDAYTGGFNLQIAFSTAYTAINSAII
ncbi:MAG: NAD(P)/FAD-dependent oxidoreductase [Clostridia bacterium]|nr:NAD(P)/FAD-dependent oxidoreductase [Clostridia bacterium]